MPTPPRALVATVRFIDTVVGEWPARLVAWLVVALTLALVYEVVARYAFGAPTLWAFDVTYMVYGSHFMLGAAYALLHGAHIRTDIFYQRWSPRTRAIVDGTLYLVFFFPGMIFFFWMGVQEAVHSWRILEASSASPWRPPLYPFKTVLPLGLLLLLVQGVSEFLKSAWLARTGEAL
jgi:TRAP-type mannitol/chloroaromatic compound transport system permease small subunit